MKKSTIIAALSVLTLSCEHADLSEPQGESFVTLAFEPTNADLTRAALATYFSKLNVQLFDSEGNKVFDKVRTQTKDEADFGIVSLSLSPGTYTIVGVGHSSTVSAAIKSPEVVQFTASNGEKLTDTFCHCSVITIPATPPAASAAGYYTLPMYRVGAMIQFCLTDTEIPDNFAYFLMEYTGGSANFNPTTLEGITKSKQSERRIRNDQNIHQAYTFPYMSTSCVLNMTVSAIDSDGSAIRTRSFPEVPVTRNRITTYVGHFFEDGDGQFTQYEFGFVVHTDWEGEEKYTF